MRRGKARLARIRRGRKARVAQGDLSPGAEGRRGSQAAKDLQKKRGEELLGGVVVR